MNTEPSFSTSRNRSPRPLERVITLRDFSPSYHGSDLVAAVASDDPLASQNSLLPSFEPNLGSNLFALTDSEITTILGHECKQALGVCVFLGINEGFHFGGHVKVVILGGTISIMGVELMSSSTAYTIFAPRSHPVPSFMCITSAVSCHSLSPRLMASMRGRGALAIFPSCSGVESLERISPRYRGLFGDQERCSLGIPGFQIEEMPVRNPMLHPPSWRKALELSMAAVQSGEPFIGLVHGPKGSGKSTFSRMLMNTLVSRLIPVAYLDCDLGQSEFSPPGLVSLHLIRKAQFGPSFTHIIRAYASRYIGTTSAKADPAYYLACISSLIDVFSAEIQGGTDHGNSALPIPLIVNTQGWVKGLGADLSDRITEMVKPSHIFALRQSSDGPDPSKGNLSRAAYHELEPVSPGDGALTLNAHDTRGLSLMSYFHLTLHGEDVFWSTNSSLCSMNPWEIHCRRAINYIAISSTEGENVVPEELENALVGGIVGLVRSEVQDKRSISGGFPYVQGGELPPPQDSECIGIAFVRYASGEEGILHLITPDDSLLADCRILVKGDIEMPASAMLSYESGVARNIEEVDDGTGSETLYGVERSRVPFLQWTTGVQGVGASKRRARRNVMRRGQM